MRVLRLPSNPRNLALIDDFVKNICRRYSVRSDKHGDMLISLTEAVTNAIIHGNNRDESKQVQIQLSKKPDSISFMVSDEGRGFDYQSLPDPTSPDNRCKCGGRGVYLMRCLSDQMEFHDNGRTVEMRFKI